MIICTFFNSPILNYHVLVISLDKKINLSLTTVCSFIYFKPLRLVITSLKLL